MPVIPIVKIILRKRKGHSNEAFHEKVIHPLYNLQDRPHCSCPYCPWVWPSTDLWYQTWQRSALLQHWILPDSWPTFILAGFQQRKTTRVCTPSLLRSQAKVILLHLERESERKSIIPAARLWLGHLPDGWGPFLASHRAQMCQHPRLTPTDGQQALEELCTAPSLGWRRMLSQ